MKLNYSSTNKIKKYNLDNIFKIAIIGRIDSYKIPNKFIEELIDFVKINDKYFFYFFGNISNNITYFDKIKELKNNIFYMGFYDEENLYNYLINNIDIVIHPSINECGSFTLIEVQKLSPIEVRHE